jgi:hypothetical protein
LQKGVSLTDQEIKKIVSLLFDTELSIPVIAQRLGCSASTVQGINRRFGIRDYAGKRSSFTIRLALDSEPASFRISALVTDPRDAPM